MTEMRKYFDDDSQYRRIASEAAFGFSELSDELHRLPAGGHVLEVGSGTGFLAAKVSRACPACHVHAIEPLGSGFSAFEHAMKQIAHDHPNVSLARSTAEDYDPSGTQFDLIYSINVFEHIIDWRAAFGRLCDMLTPNGQMIILCPNYTVPYESHFGIPMIGGPRLTKRLFSARIKHVEKTCDAEGLWDSLNFIKSTQLAQAARDKGVTLQFDRTIMTRMFRRLTTDAEFSERQGAIAGIARGMFRFGLGSVLDISPVRCLPYMKARVSLTRDLR